MKIGFLAMSGVRAHDAELLKFGLTLPGFVDRSKVIAQLPSLGLLYLAAVTPIGHDLHYYEAGHMMYIHMPSLKAQAKHLRDFVKKAK